jgi:hypothetical protein
VQGVQPLASVRLTWPLGPARKLQRWTNGSPLHAAPNS